jgi:hypothetical protein
VLYFRSIYEGTRPPEQIMLETIAGSAEQINKRCEAFKADIQEHNAKTGDNREVSCRPLLDKYREILALQIRQRTDILRDFGNDVSLSYQGFLVGERKILIQLRRNVIDEQSRL